MVTLREPSAKSFWDNLESLNAQLEELGINENRLWAYSIFDALRAWNVTPHTPSATERIIAEDIADAFGNGVGSLP